jgi:hypothetical protein
MGLVSGTNHESPPAPLSGSTRFVRKPPLLCFWNSPTYANINQTSGS